MNPNGGTTETRRPTLTFANATPQFVPTTNILYDVEVQDANASVVYARTISELTGSTSHTLEEDLAFATTYWFRVRAKVGNDVSSWSNFAQFRTPEPPPPPPPTTVPPPTTGGAGLPFPVPPQCGPFGPDAGFGCAAAIAAQSVEWAGCASGVGTRCHRFTRQVAYALALSDPNWALITAAPGGHACNCNSCGPSDGTMFREDTIVYAGRSVYDMIVGAGGPTPSLNWSLVPGPRPGDIPALAPLCAP